MKTLLAMLVLSALAGTAAVAQQKPAKKNMQTQADAVRTSPAEANQHDGVPANVRTGNTLNQTPTPAAKPRKPKRATTTRPAQTAQPGQPSANVGTGLTNDQAQAAAATPAAPTQTDANSGTYTNASGVKAKKKAPK